MRDELFVLFAVTASLADDTGYTVNARRTLAGLRSHGTRVSVLQLVNRHDIGSARRYSATDPDASVLLAPLDRAVPLANRLIRIPIRRYLHELCRENHRTIIHARGIRAGHLLGGALAPVVLDVRGDIVAEAESMQREGLPANVALARDMQNRAFGCASGLLVVSDAMLDWARDLGVSDTVPSRVVPCSVDIRSVSGIEPHAEFRIAYSGGFQSYQPARLVIDTMARLISLVPDSVPRVLTYHVPAFNSAAREAALNWTAEQVDSADVHKALAECDLGIVPRLPDPVNWVSCPTKIPDCLAAGVPVLVSDAAGEWGRRMEEWGVGARLDSDDATLIALCADIAANREVYRLRCQAVARRHFSIESASLSISSLYQEVLGSV